MPLHSSYENKAITIARRKTCGALLFWSVLGSLSVHGLMLAAMIAPVMQLPVVATTEKTDFFQLSSLFFLGGGDVPPDSLPKQQDTANHPPIADTGVAVSSSLKDAVSAPEQTPEKADEIPATSDDPGKAPEMVVPSSVTQDSGLRRSPPATGVTARQAPLPATPPAPSTPATGLAPRKLEPEEADTGEATDTGQEDDRLAVMQEEALHKAEEEAARQAESARLALERKEQARLEREKSAQEQKAEQERNTREAVQRQAEQRLAEQERLAREKARRQQLAREQAEQERKARELAEQKRADREQRARQAAEQERNAREAAQRQAEQERLAKEKARRQQLALEQAAQERKARELAEQKRVAREQSARQAAEQERNAREAAQRQAVQERLAQEKSRRQQLALEQAAQERKARELAEQQRFAEQKARQEQLAREQAERDGKIRDEALRRIEQQNRDRILQENNRLAAEKNWLDQLAKMRNDREVKGIPVPIVTGDLKLVISGKKYQPLTVVFKEFRKSRRGKPFTRAETRNATPVFPVMVTTRTDVREAVIEKAREGVYTFSQAHCDNCGNSFSLILYDTTARMVKKTVHPQTVGGKDVVARILMPEGILWDDEAAFTGSIEDTDSITKFESASGLVWKEYTE